MVRQGDTCGRGHRRSARACLIAGGNGIRLRQPFVKVDRTRRHEAPARGGPIGQTDASLNLPRSGCPGGFTQPGFLADQLMMLFGGAIAQIVVGLDMDAEAAADGSRHTK